VTTPANYDEVTLAVDPDELLTLSNQGLALCDQVADQINAIGSTMSGLQLSWTGASAQAAESFSNRWNALMTQMFGTTGDSGGVLPTLVGALATTGNNFDSAEQNIAVMFTMLHNSIGDGSSAPAPPAGPVISGLPGSIDDPTQTAVSETFTSNAL
jgi:uncharacterized protein YukE